jgi:broad specificity phosphatase PhoE
MSNISIIGIRHGEAIHNVLYDHIGTDAFTQFQDTTLTSRGMLQALEARLKVPGIDVVLVSPLMRTLQTASVIFPGVKMIALDELMEYPQNTEICNQRSEISDLTNLFPHVDFSYTSQDNGFGVKDADAHLEKQTEKFNKILKSFTPNTNKIAIVSHSSWLKHYINGTIGDIYQELPHCEPLPIVVTNKI